MADGIVIMKDGVVQQMDAPLNVYDNPANLFVAGFIGTPPMNSFRGDIRKIDDQYYSLIQRRK